MSVKRGKDLGGSGRRAGGMESGQKVSVKAIKGGDRRHGAVQVLEAKAKLEEALEILAADSPGGEAAFVGSGVVFAQTVHDILGDVELPPEVERRAALTAAASLAWQRELGPLLSGQEVRALLGGVTRQRLDQRVRAGQVIALTDANGRRVYPLMQFDEDRLLEPLVAAHHILVHKGHTSPWTAASWCVTPHPELERQSPREWLRAGNSDASLLAVAEHDAARLAQ